MKFKKLELYGFKSFADKVEIPFNDGFTAIIGPNGCGKSNVSDAIRWVFGEQSAKSLRGSSMQDVIFQGTEKRRRLSYCEVSVYLDNTDRQLFPSLAFDQVVITRKLDASRQSEYSINNSQCRLKDIVNLLHDTGIGKDGYSIIGQGKVEEILSKKSEDRRAVFDEAAGISKFRADRTAARNDLEKTNLNLQAINEVIAGTESGIAPLRKQAEAARKYEELRERLKVCEVNYFIYKYEDSKRVKENLTARIVAHREEGAKADADLAACNTRYRECLDERDGIDKLQTEFNAELLELKVGAERVAGEANVVRERVINLQNEIDRLEGEIKSNRASSAVADELIAKAEEKRRELVVERDKTAAELARLRERHRKLTSALGMSESDIDAKSASYIEALNKLNELRGTLASVDGERKFQRERLKNLGEEIADKKSRLAAEQTEYEANESAVAASREKIKELTTRRNESLYEKSEAAEAVEAIGADIDGLSRKLAAAEASLALQKNIKNDYEGYQDAVKHLMRDATRDPRLAGKALGVLAELISVPQEYETAIEYALGGALQNVIVETEREAGELITHLKQHSYGRVTFRPLSSCRPHGLGPEYRAALGEPGCFGIAADLVECDTRYYPVVQSLLGSTVVVDGMRTAERMYRDYRQGFRIVTLDGEIYSRGGEITGGSRRSQRSGLLSQEKEIERLQASVDKLRSEIRTMQAMRDDRKREIQLADETVAELDGKLATLRLECSLADDKCEQARAAVAELEAEVERLSATYREVEASLAELDKQIKAVDDLEQVVVSRRREHEELSKLRSVSSEQKSERETLAAQVTEMSVKNAEQTAAVDGAEAEISRLRAEKRAAENERIELEAELAAAKNALEDIKKTPGKTVFSEEDKRRIAELEGQLTRLDERKGEIAKMLQELDEEREKLNRIRSEAGEKRVRVEGMLDRAEADMRDMQQHILETYDLTYASSLALRLPDYEPRGAKGEIEELKKSMARLGPINPLAEETLAELEAKLDELVVQRNDIVTARDDIISVIDNLTSMMAEKFSAAFEQIRENFRVVFAQLFEGGRGDLSLNFTETDDPLEAGIDILVQPPGKRLGNIMLLSGGEKALSAIALLFAILKLHPVPFCVLDEIDSALDDTNAAIFASFLKKYLSETQFIVITHRKATMRLADSIFGVTMEEKGVTKIVSITFEEAQRRVARQD